MSASYRNLFLRQSYLDCYDEYQSTLTNPRAVLWDYVFLTASGEDQAEAYRRQIDSRLAAGRLPRGTRFFVLPDPDGKRVGSGGATLNVLREIVRDRGSADFTDLRILVIHSGGDSRRIPQYSACGKLFSPVPRLLPDGRRSTLFDEFIIGMSGVPARLADGMLVCSGDVLLLFNPLQIDSFSTGAAAFSVKEDAAVACHHGVFLGDEEGNVDKFLHKQTVKTLRESGAADSSDRVDLDTGAVVFDSRLLAALYGLVASDEGFAEMVNEEVCLSFYADFLYPLAASSTHEDYMEETPERQICPALLAAREKLWAALSPFSMKLIRFSPAAFLHFGTTRELLRLMTAEIADYRFLDWQARVITNTRETHYAAGNSYVSRAATVGEGSYIEDSYVRRGTHIGRGCVISGVTLEGVTVPDGCVLHGLKLRDGRFTVRMYGVEDNPKEAMLFGQPIGESLWTAPLYPVCDSMTEAVAATLAVMAGEAFDGEKISLRDGFLAADVAEIIPWQNHLTDKVKAETLLEFIDRRVPFEKVLEIFHGEKPSPRVVNILVGEAEAQDAAVLDGFSRKIRIYEYLSDLLGDETYAERAYDTVSSALTEASGIVYRTDALPAIEEATVRLPVRINFGGGWSDTPPYCNENGGTVLNAAVRLDGTLPIEARASHIKENAFWLCSTDGHIKRRFTDLAKLTDCRDPADPFALHKATLIACGIIPQKPNGETVAALTARMGGGIRLTTRVIGIPKGSGLGTSSILAGACVRAVCRLFGWEPTDNEVVGRVLVIEQIMSTGGGWQDQVGGLVPGIKMVTSRAGLAQNITVTPLSLTPETKAELDERFVLIYTGQRRLARNLLRGVMSKYVTALPETVSVLGRIQRAAALMRFELERGNVNGFAHLLSEHWELSKKLDGGCTNTCIEQIFNTIDDLIEGKMICGAGGGGFLQVVLRRGVTFDMLSNRLHAVFADSGVTAWRTDFVYEVE